MPEKSPPAAAKAVRMQLAPRHMEKV
jgi:hypothetical protein